MRHAAAATLLCGLAVRLWAQLPPPPSAEEVRFDVVSIRPSGPNRNPECQPPTCYSAFFRPRPGRFGAVRMSVLGLVGYAYSMPENRLAGPAWTKSEEYEIDATHGLPAGDQAGVRVMLQRLLHERFALQVHREQTPHAGVCAFQGARRRAAWTAACQHFWLR